MSSISKSYECTTFNALDRKLAGFTVKTDSDKEFISKLKLGYKIFLSKNMLSNELERIQVIENELMESLTILGGECLEPQYIATENSSIDDFLEFCIENSYQSLNSYFASIVELIRGDLSYVVTFQDINSDKGRKKIINGFTSYGYSIDKIRKTKDRESAMIECIKELLVLFDMTTLGSGKSGIILTKTYLAFESIYTSREFIYINDIENISLNTSERELTVNNKKLKFIDSEIIYPLKKTIECINQYLQQPSIKLKEHLVRTKLYG